MAAPNSPPFLAETDESGCYIPNDPPSIAATANLTVDEDSSVTHTIAITDPDEDDTHELVIHTEPANGSVTINEHSVTYTPNKDWNGTDMFLVRAKDHPYGDFSEAQEITVTVKPVNDAPSIPATANSSIEQDTVHEHVVVITDPDFDMPNDSHTIELVDLPQGGVVTFAQEGRDYKVIYTPNKYWDGSEAFSVRVKDEAGAYSAAQQVTVTVERDQIPPAVSIDGEVEVVTSDGAADVKLGDIGIQITDNKDEDPQIVSAVLTSSRGENIALTVSQTGAGQFELQEPFPVLPDNADYTLVVTGRDNKGNEAVAQTSFFIPDTTPPTISIIGAGNSSLAAVGIRLTDTGDDDPQIISVVLAGGALGEPMEIAAYQTGPGQFQLVQPAENLPEGEAYTLTVVARDQSGNSSTEIASFTLSPQIADGSLAIEGLINGRLMIPAIAHEFVRPDGSGGIKTVPLTHSDGSVLSGVHSILATLDGDAETPLVVNGVTVLPGKTVTVASSYDFDANKGGINLPVRPVEGGAIIETKLRLIPAVPGASAIMLNVGTWEGAAQLYSNSWEVRQIVDPVEITVHPTSGTLCTTTSNEYEVKRADVFSSPVCLVEWAQTPDEAQPTSIRNTPAIQGQAVKLGQQPVSYKLYLVSGDGQRVQIGEGQNELTVISAMDSVSYAPSEDQSAVRRLINDAEVRLRQAYGPTCRLTTDASMARSSSNRAFSYGSTQCLLEWTEIPDGMQQDLGIQTPYLFGTIRENGKYPIGWEVSVFSIAGEKIMLASEAVEMNVVDPDSPKIQVQSNQHLTGDLYTALVTGGYLGDAIFEAENSSLDIQILRNGNPIVDEAFPKARSSVNRVSRRLNTEPASMWEESVYTLNAAYTLHPEISSSLELRTMAIPSSFIIPQIEVKETEVLDSELLPVTVKIIDQLNLGSSFDVATMGNWSVRLGQQIGSSRIDPMTDFKPMVDGVAEIDLDISAIDKTLRLVAEARLDSPIEEYERSELSRPVFMTVLRGSAIDADLEARKMSGSAPFRAVLQLGFLDNLDRAATGDVTWQISSDGGATWDEHTESDRNRFRLSATFDKGEYLVRAHIKNIHSGAESVTETVEIIAYDKLAGSIIGETIIFEGTTQTYGVEVFDRQGEPLEDYRIKWSLDNGKTFVSEEREIDVSSDTAQRIRLEAWVTDLAAPEDDPYAHTRLKSAAEFRKSRGPGVYMTGPRVIEIGEEYEYIVRLSQPYAKMNEVLMGEFILPNGDRVPGTTLTYTPTDEDLSSLRAKISYEAWVDGYRDAGTIVERDLTARVWEYVWPNWAMSVRKTASVAPSEVTLQARALSKANALEGLSYTWEINGPSIEVIQDRSDSYRQLALMEPGEYTFVVSVADARGNVTVLEEVIDVGAADPFVIEVQMTPENEYMRAPLGIRLRPSVTGGHPNDRVTDYKYSVNGVEIDNAGFGARADLDAGSHQIGLTINTRMGREETEIVNVEVTPNQPPVCTGELEDRGSSWRVHAQCEDVDGRVRTHEWKVNGEVVSVQSNRLTLQKRVYGDVFPTVEFVGFDDSGAASSPVVVQ